MITFINFLLNKIGIGIGFSINRPEDFIAWYKKYFGFDTDVTASIIDYNHVDVNINIDEKKYTLHYTLESFNPEVSKLYRRVIDVKIDKN